MSEASEHFDWCLKRADEYLERGDKENALASFFSDMKKNPTTREMLQPELCAVGLLFESRTLEGTRRFIHGFRAPA